jgi:hypothetical protein
MAHDVAHWPEWALLRTKDDGRFRTGFEPAKLISYTVQFRVPLRWLPMRRKFGSWPRAAKAAAIPMLKPPRVNSGR